MGEKIHLVAIPPGSAERVRPVVSPFLAGVIDCSQGTNDLDSIIRLCQEEKAQLWVALRDSDREAIGAFATRIDRFPLKSCCTVWAAGGAFREMVAGTVGALEDYARAEDCSQILVEGPGFIRKMLADYGDLVRVVICREVRGDGYERK